jgi:uncharacterized protein (DUF58 family)
MTQPLLARFPMEGHVSGHHKSPHRGSSVEFAEYRNYTPGDDIRRLDWRVFGRTDRFYMKEFEADTNLRCYLVLDCSGSMAFGAEGATKLDYARRLLATLGYLLVQQGDAAGLVCVGTSGARDIPPRRTPSHLRLILDTLEGIRAAGTTQLIPALHDLAEKARRRALVVVASDCFVDVEGLMGAFQHLRFQKHDLAVWQVLSEPELEFPFDRPLRFLDLEGPGAVVTEPAMIRAEYLRCLTAHLERLRRGCNELRADYRQVRIEQSYERVLADFLVERARLRAAAGR